MAVVSNGGADEARENGGAEEVKDASSAGKGGVEGNGEGNAEAKVKGVFCEPVAHKAFVCPHECFLHPGKVPEMKIISGWAFDAMVAAVGAPDHDFRAETYRCELCVNSLQRESAAATTGQQKYVNALAKLEKSDEKGAFEGEKQFLLSRGWAAKFKQAMDTLLRHVTKQNGSLQKAGAAADEGGGKPNADTKPVTLGEYEHEHEHEH
uniref:Uncharacterized protein n=1 Tax=Phaeomonas parva TaxID=124430 RepID=A0A7S1XKV9_9STRA|mmetsp:Transcript_15944/g.48681  ORF Transcript_15944/g.48681 Transcript_15944/m.48681 type:complete len:208 (+) Transcript_15944:140-763(+)